jgi:hypothetical protein
MEPYNAAFIYIFEYSTISGDTENWIFAVSLGGKFDFLGVLAILKKFPLEKTGFALLRLFQFQGASSSPQIQFNVQDACRDYQFRAIVVLRSTDPALQLVVFRPRAIPVILPKFVVPPESAS